MMTFFKSRAANGFLMRVLATTRSPSLRPALALLGLFLLIGSQLVSHLPAAAHFSKGVKLRTILVTEDKVHGGVIAYVRSPAPLVFSDLILAAQTGQKALQSSFLIPEATDTGLQYRLRLPPYSEHQGAILHRLEWTLTFSQSGLPLESRTLDYTVHARAPQQRLETADQCELALTAPRPDKAPVFGDAVIDYKLWLPEADPNLELSVVSGLPPVITNSDVAIDQHLRDLRLDPPQALAVPGQLEKPVTLGGSRVYETVLFVLQGIRHILEGPDHLLLIVALVLGVGPRSRLLWLITAFALGHSLTLIVTFLGGTPSWPSFIPLVETAIALSVLYAAVAALLHRAGNILVFGAIGLLHGLGFSFQLADILGRHAPGLIHTLLIFNIGIELGQMIILGVTLAVMFSLRRLVPPIAEPFRLAVLIGIIGLSCWWVAGRSVMIF